MPGKTGQIESIPPLQLDGHGTYDSVKLSAEIATHDQNHLGGQERQHRREEAITTQLHRSWGS